MRAKAAQALPASSTVAATAPVPAPRATRASPTAATLSKSEPPTRPATRTRTPSRTWTVDSTGPDTSITAAPADLTNTANASFSFSASEAGSSFACQLDGGGYSACTSPKSYTGSPTAATPSRSGPRDAAGNTDPTPASRTWTIDTQAPHVTLATHPSGGTTRRSDPTFAGTGGDRSGRFDDGHRQAVQRLADGRHADPDAHDDVGGREAPTHGRRPSPLVGGTYTARAEQRDADDNLG